jgi:hypothetical protein
MRRRASSVQTRSAVSATAAAATATARYQQQQQQLLQLQEDLRKTENIIYLQLRFTLYYSERLLLCFIPRKLLFFSFLFRFVRLFQVMLLAGCSIMANFLTSF